MTAWLGTMCQTVSGEVVFLLIQTTPRGAKLDGNSGQKNQILKKKGLSKSRQDMIRDHQQANGTASNHQPSDSVETAAGLEFTPSLSWQTKAIPPLDRARDQRNSAGNAL